MRRTVELVLIVCGAIAGFLLAHVRTRGSIEVLGTTWSLTLLPGLLFIVPLGGVHGFLAEVIWPVILASNTLAYALIVFLAILIARRVV